MIEKKNRDERLMREGRYYEMKERGDKLTKGRQEGNRKWYIKGEKEGKTH